MLSLFSALSLPCSKRDFPKRWMTVLQIMGFALETHIVSCFASPTWEDCCQHRGTCPTLWAELCHGWWRDNWKADMGQVVWRTLMENMTIPWTSSFLSIALVPGDGHRTWVSVCGGINPPQSQERQDHLQTTEGRNTCPTCTGHLYPSALPAWVRKDSTQDQISHTLTNRTKNVLSPFEEKQGGKRGKVQLQLNCPIKHFTTTNQSTFDCAIEPEQCRRLQNACLKRRCKTIRSHKEPLPRREGPPLQPPAQPTGAFMLMLATHAKKAQERCFVSK